MEQANAAPNESQSNFEELDKSIKFNGATLHGTLCLPLNTAPKQLVLMLPGSGELDRNENAMKMQLNTFNAIAHHFAANGIASFRYDKRGCSMSGGNYHETGFLNFVDDAEAWLNSMNSYAGLSNTELYLLGHSEGTLISAMLSSSNTLVRGQILLTPFLQNLEIIIEQQLIRTLAEVGKLQGFKGVMVRMFIRLSGNQLKKQQRLMKRVKNTSKSTIKLKKTLINAKWLREISEIEPKDIYQKVSVPTLSIGGEKDLQCEPQDAARVKEYVKGEVQTHVLPNLTHILRVDEGEPSTFKYKELVEKELDPRVCDIAVEWLQAQPLTHSD